MSEHAFTAVQAVAEAVPGFPRDTEGPVFREPWEAQAFAMTVEDVGGKPAPTMSTLTVIGNI